MKVLTYQPLKSILQCLNTSRGMAKWAVILRKFDISYRPHPAMKAQALTNFITKCSWVNGEVNQREEGKGQGNQEKADEDSLEPTWILHMDGASNSLGSGAGLILTNSEGVVAEYALIFPVKALNNQVDYEALLAS